MTAATSAVLSGQSDIKDWQESLYKDLHAHPELSHQEFRTAKIVAEQLRTEGFAVHDGIGGTGVVGVLENGAGPVVLLRADMDALPVAEATGLDFASTAAGIMHACGHDIHVSCLLGAARLMAGSRGSWAGTLVALFQPGEEAGDGAQGMVDGGLTSRVPRPDVVLGQHVLAHPAGTVSPHSGTFLSMADSVRITLHGRGSHGSMPHLSIDPAVLASMVVIRLQGIVSREITPGEFAVVTVGRIAVGAKSNIIDDHAVLELNIRTYDRTVRDQILAAIERIARAESAASGSPKEPEFEIYDSYPLTDNSAEATQRVSEAFRDHFGELVTDYGRQTASEDFSVIPDAFGVPYTYWGIGGIDPDTYRGALERGTVSAEIPANHSPRFAPILEPTLESGTAALVVAALAWLGQ